HFARFESLVRNGQPHSVLLYDAGAVHHQRLVRRASFAGSADAAALATKALGLRAMETELRAHADFLTCASSQELTFLLSTPGSAGIAVVPSPRHDAQVRRPGYGTARSVRTSGVWIEALQQALSSRDSRARYLSAQWT